MTDFAVTQGTALGASEPKVYAAIELSKAKWIVAIRIPGSEKISLFQIDGGDVDRLTALLDRARKRAGSPGGQEIEICTCYEAGYDGFWLHRALVSRGIRNLVLDSSSILVSRRKRNVKTDRSDAESLLRVLMAYDRGERRACSVVRVPTPEEEDRKRLLRSRESLLRERIRHTNRIRGLLGLQGVRHIIPNRPGWTSQLKGLVTRDGRPFPQQLLREIRREAKLLALVDQMLKQVEAEVVEATRPQKAGRTGRRVTPNPIAVKLVRIRGVGHRIAGVLATEVFYRSFGNRREIASYFGLAPTPHSSGTMSRDQGISKAGNRRARHHAIELAWMWLRHQPGSELSLWFNRRVSDARGRVRRIAIVALARKLVVALWRYLERGVTPEGAMTRA